MAKRTQPRWQTNSYDVRETTPPMGCEFAKQAFMLTSLSAVRVGQGRQLQQSGLFQRQEDRKQATYD
eukprot:1386323-Rhodomonas_salina.2